VAPWDEGVLQAELAKLVDAELLFVRGRPPQASYQFKHALIRDAAYQSMLKTKRQQFHGRIGAVLEQRFPDSSAAQPELLAHHFTEGGVLPRAVAYWERAGERAQQRGAAEEAVGHFRRGLGLLRDLPETPDRHAQEIRLHISLGVALESISTSGGLEVAATYERAHALSVQTGLTAQVLPALYGRLRHCLDRGQNARARELGEEMLRLAEQAGNSGFALAAHSGLGTALFLQGEHAEALPHFEQVLATPATATLRAALHPHVLVDPWVASQTFLSLSLLLLGYPDRSGEHSRQAVGTAEGLGHPYSLGFALCYAGWLHTFRAEREATAATAARALALGKEKGFAGLVALAKIVGAWTLAASAQEEVATIRAGLEELRALFAVSDCTDFLTLFAEACARAGRPDEGLQALAEAQEFLEVTQEYFWQAEVYRLQGEMLLQSDPTAVTAAAACFDQALAVARRQQARALELRAAMSLARLWAEQGKSQAAEALLAPVYAAFTEGFQTHDLQAARALLDHYRSGPR
jgi:predicted ATPase